MRNRFWFGGAIVVAALSVSIAASVEGDVKRLSDAGDVLMDMHAAPDKDIPMDLWEKAKCVAVIPSVKKAAFIIGGEYGKGVISCRFAGSWSAPSFLLLEKGSWGFQIGAESVDLVLLVMNDRGLDKLLDNKVALGGEVSIAGGPVGRDARAMTDIQMKAQILSYSRAQGLFAGVDLTGGVIKTDADENRDYYRKPISAQAILFDGGVTPPASARPFMNALWRGETPSR